MQIIDIVKDAYKEAFNRSVAEEKFSSLDLLSQLLYIGYIDLDKFDTYKKNIIETLGAELHLEPSFEGAPLQVNIPLGDKYFYSDRELPTKVLIDNIKLEKKADYVYIVPTYLTQEFNVNSRLLYYYMWYSALNNKATDIHLLTETDVTDLTPTVSFYLRLGVELRKFNIGNLSTEDVYRLSIFIITELSVNTSVKSHLTLRAETRVSVNDGSNVGRVSIVSGAYGYSMTIRILNVKSALNIEELNFEPNIQQALYKASKRDRGLTLAIGKFGSGKGTTINSIIKEISNAGIHKIISIDSPIEYRGPYTQLEYHEEYELESIVSAVKKQDVNVIALNEIADRYVGQHINDLLQSGSYVLTTIHSSSLPNVIMKLKSVFGDAYKDLLPYINLLMYQDKFSKTCTKCRRELDISYFNTSSQEHHYMLENNLESIKQPIGCEECSNTKIISGLKIVAEYLELNEEQKDILVNLTAIEQTKYLKDNIKYPMRNIIVDEVSRGNILIQEACYR